MVDLFSIYDFRYSISLEFRVALKAFSATFRIIRYNVCDHEDLAWVSLRRPV